VIIIYTPAGGVSEQYDASTLRVSEASIVQRTVDMKWQDILEGLERDDLDAMRGIVWAIKKRSEPTLRFGDFDPGVTEMTSRMDKGEVERWVDNAFASADDELTPETVTRILLSRMPDVAADPEHARALIEAKGQDPKEAEAPEPDTEAPQSGDSSPTPTSSEPASTTSDSSPTSSTSLPSSSMT
jgi:hypothetical protein